jgi:iron complex outermembrane receptor protein
MKTYLRYAIVIGVLIFCNHTFAQNEVSGTVIDDFTNEPLFGANVTIEGTYVGKITDLDGKFDLQTSKEFPFTVIISYVGYATQKIIVTDSGTTLDVNLVEGVQMNEVVVTSQLREQVLQEVPIAVSVVGSKMIEANPSIKTVNDILAFVPGLSGGDFTGGSAYNIRGVSSVIFNNSFENSVGIFQDGIFTGRISAAGNEFYDVDRIEVLKGPQGTLFGRNTAAGAVSVHSNQPKAYKDISLALTTGNEGQLIGDYVFNLPLSEKFRVRLAGRYQKRDPLVKATDPVTGVVSDLNKTDFFGNRLSFQLLPSDKFKATLLLSYSTSDRGGTANVSTSPFLRDDLGVPIPDDPFTRTIEQNGPPRDKTKNFGGTLMLDAVLNENLFLESITGVRNNDLDYRFDVDASSFNVAMFENPDEGTSFTQEFRLKGKGSRLDWLAAVSLFNENSTQTAVLEADAEVLDILFADGTLGLSPSIDRETHVQKAKTFSVSTYADATYQLSEKFDITAGFRLSYDKKETNYAAQLSDGAFQQTIGANVLTVDFGYGTIDQTADKSWVAFQPRLNLSFKASDDVLIYAGYSRGYKPGGLNDYDLRIVEPEFNNAYELGLKTNFAENRGLFNLSGFYYDYSNLQVLEVVDARVGVNNAADVKSLGLEIETSYEFFDGFTLGGNVALINAEYKDFVTDSGDFSGNKTIYTPDVTYRINAEYRKRYESGFGFYIQTDYAYQSEVFFHESNSDDRKSDAFGLWNATAGVTGLFKNKADIGLFFQNITDEKYIVNARDDLGGLPYITRGNPFYTGVTIRLNNLLDW